MVRTSSSHAAQSAARKSVPLVATGAELKPANRVDFGHANLRLGIAIAALLPKRFSVPMPI